MKSEQRLLIIWAIFSITMIIVVSMLHSLGDDLFLLTIWFIFCIFTLNFMYIVIISPLDKEIGRLEGETIFLKRLKETLRKLKRKKCR